jgi:hypothetical protein
LPFHAGPGFRIFPILERPFPNFTPEFLEKADERKEHMKMELPIFLPRFLRSTVHV